MPAARFALRPTPRRFWALVALIPSIVASLSLANAQSDGFAGGIAPSRFELVAKPGEVVRRALKIYNLGDRPHEFKIETNDWTYSAEGDIAFSDQLATNSCRPWVKLERHKVKILPSAMRPRRYRFEVHVPENAPAQECRFAIMLSSNADPHRTELGQGLSLPATGKIGIVVYVGIGDVKADLAVNKYLTKSHDGTKVPAVQVTNQGQAHGRLDAELRGVDAKGQKMNLHIATSPIMPDQTRVLELTPDQAFRDSRQQIAYPLAINGRIFTETGSIKVETLLE